MTSTCQTPQRQILDPKDMSKWLASSAYSDIVSFVEQLSQSVQGRKVSSVGALSPQVEGIVSLLSKAESWISKFPPDLATSSRFGNKSFRSWAAELQQQAEHLQRELLPVERHDAATELAPYLVAAFGNATRIDYGSGHELSFVMWLL
ncbi:Serine/threonine-protein phosphatase 2A activator 2, partial [Coemansia furcata]